MPAAPKPANERARLGAVNALGILNTPAEERFDRVTRLARRIFNVPIATITIVDEDVQWFKSVQGMNKTGDPRDVAFCAHAILEDKPLVVNDTAQDERFEQNPLVTGDPNIRFYAGQPLHDPNGMRIGTLCIIDRHPRTITPDELLTLRDLGAWVESELTAKRLSGIQQKLIEELDATRRQAILDDLTQVWNRRGILELLGREINYAREQQQSLAILMVDIDDFKSINDSYGHLAGDAVLRDAAAKLRTHLRASDALGRYGGEEFLALLAECDLDNAARIAEKLRAAFMDEPIAVQDSTVPIHISIGVTMLNDSSTADTLIAAADVALYAAKGKGRNRVETAS